MKRTLKALEFDKVLELFSDFCISESAKKKVLNLIPHLNPYGIDFLSLYHNRELFSQTKEWLRETQYTFHTFAELEGVIHYLQSPTPLLESEALWAIKEALLILKNICLSVLEKENRYSLLANFITKHVFPEEAFEALQHCVGDNGAIKDNASPALLLVRNELRGLNQTCLRQVKEAAAEYNILHYLQDDYLTLASDRYVLPLKANFKGRLQGIIHHYSNTGETVFFEPLFLVEINNHIQELKQQEREEERKILLMLTKLLQKDLSALEHSWDLLLELDILQAKVLLASRYEGHCLIMEENTALNLVDAKHPLLALEATTHQKNKVTPIQISLRSEERVLIISGGNAGGKTVCLKTTGLIVLMVLAGLPVPVAENSTLPFIEKIHAFIGDEQSLDDHLSTFTGQIKHLSKAWESLNSLSLILLDEFGAGTDPAQGAALAQGVIDGILEKQSFALAATHFPALKTYALSKPHVRAASVLFHPQTKKPLFTLAYDQVGASIALDVAREHGLPESILKRAEQYLLLDGEDMSHVLDTLNSLALEREKEIARLQEENKKAQEKRKAAQLQFEAERKKLHAEVKNMSSTLMLAWKEGKATAKQSLKEMAKLRSTLLPTTAEAQNISEKDQESLLLSLKTGQSLQYIPWGKKGIIAEIDTRNKKVKLNINGVSLWVPLKDTHADTANNVKQNHGTHTQINSASENTSFLRLDIRGKRADIALAELEYFLDKALLNSTDYVEIIHGKGTGALRKSVHEFLRTYKMAQHFQLATEEQGGDGMTLVYFK